MHDPFIFLAVGQAGKIWKMFIIYTQPESSGESDKIIRGKWIEDGRSKKGGHGVNERERQREREREREEEGGRKGKRHA